MFTKTAMCTIIVHMNKSQYRRLADRVASLDTRIKRKTQIVESLQMEINELESKRDGLNSRIKTTGMKRK